MITLLAIIVSALSAIAVATIYHVSKPVTIPQSYAFWRRGKYYAQRGGKPDCEHDNSDYLGDNQYSCLDCGAWVQISRHSFLR